MYQGEEKHHKANSKGGIGFIDEEHGGRGREAAEAGGLPAEKLEAWTEVGGGANLEQEAGQIHDEEGHLREVRMSSC